MRSISPRSNGLLTTGTHAPISACLGTMRPCTRAPGRRGGADRVAAPSRGLHRAHREGRHRGSRGPAPAPPPRARTPTAGRSRAWPTPRRRRPRGASPGSTGRPRRRTERVGPGDGCHETAGHFRPAVSLRAWHDPRDPLSALSHPGSTARAQIRVGDAETVETGPAQLRIPQPRPRSFTEAVANPASEPSPTPSGVVSRILPCSIL